MKKKTNTNSRMYLKGMFHKDAFKLFLLKIMYKIAIFNLEKASSIQRNVFYCLSEYTKLPLMNFDSNINLLHFNFCYPIINDVSYLNNKNLDVTKYLRFYWDG